MPNIWLLKQPLLVLAKRAIILALQAIFAASPEEYFAMRADKHGFRDSNGKFRSKLYAILRASLGVGSIASCVAIIPIIVNKLFTHFFIQSFGMGLLGSILLVHISVDNWTINKRDYILISLGLLCLVIPPLYTLL